MKIHLYSISKTLEEHAQSSNHYGRVEFPENLAVDLVSQPCGMLWNSIVAWPEASAALTLDGCLHHHRFIFLWRRKISIMRILSADPACLKYKIMGLF